MRRLLPIATLLSLLCMLGTQALWIRSLYARDRIAMGVASHHLVITTFPHHVLIEVQPGWEGMLTEVQFGLDPYPPSAKYLVMRSVRTSEVAIPFWIFELFAAALPLWWMIKMTSRSRRDRRGLCLACGYDLRASVDRCPECGEPIVRAIP